MNRQIFFLILIYFLLINLVQTRDYETFQLLKETKTRVKHGIECLPPSKYYAGSCYTYMKTSSASSWDRAYNNCLSLPMTKDARLLAIETVDEYEFIERELIGLKSGSDSVSVYIGLRKINNTWYWSNDIPLKETPVYRFWVDNNRDILAYDCGILWLARNTSVITPAPCVEQALRPYVCKQIIDRCYNNSENCGKYGKCINLPLINSYKCQCRFFYTGDHCEKWSSQGLQILIGSVIIFIAFIISYIIEDSHLFRKSSSNSNQSKIIHSSISYHLCSSYKKKSFSLKRIILILLSILLTIILCIIIFQIQKIFKEKNFFHTKELIEFCILYENNYYHHLLTLPISLVIILLIIFNETRKEYQKFNKEKLKIFLPIPFNPFSKLNRFDTMILSGIVSHEILEIIEEIFFKTIQIKFLTIHGPLFDLIRQIGLIIIISLRYYPIYSIFEMSNINIIYYISCALYMWLDLILKIFQQIFCINMNSFIRLWQKFQQFKNNFPVKYQTNSFITTTTTTMFMPEYEDVYSEGLKTRFQRFRERTSTIHSYETSTVPFHALNWSSIDLNISSSMYENNSQSIFNQFGIDSSIINIIKYAPYYLFLIYICCRLTYLIIRNLYHSFFCCQNEGNSIKKHIYHEPTFSSKEIRSNEYYYVYHLFQKSSQNKKHISLIKSFFYKIYQPNQYFHYSKQILNMYMIAFMLIYYLTINILQNSCYLIEKFYHLISLIFFILYDEFDLPETKSFHLKYEFIFACFLTAMIYFGQLLFGIKNYRKHMLNAYQGIYFDIPFQFSFQNTQFISKHIHYPGYCIAYLILGYILIGNILFIILIGLRILFKHLFLLEEFAKIFIPLLTFYFMKFIIQWFISRTFFLQKYEKIFILKNLRIYFIFIYFNFFFDCFLGIISCIFRLIKSWFITFIYLPRLDYCIFGRTLEKFDSGFLSYISYIHMECLHTHPVLIYYCSIINEKIHKRYQYLRISKRDIDLYTNHQRILFRWWLLITLYRNRRLIQLRKHQLRHLKTLSMKKFHPNIIIPNHTTTCTTLLLDVDEQDDRKSSSF